MQLRTFISVDSFKRRLKILITIWCPVLFIFAILISPLSYNIQQITTWSLFRLNSFNLSRAMWFFTWNYTTFVSSVVVLNSLRRAVNVWQEAPLSLSRFMLFSCCRELLLFLHLHERWIHVLRVIGEDKFKELLRILRSWFISDHWPLNQVTTHLSGHVCACSIDTQFVAQLRWIIYVNRWL